MAQRKPGREIWLSRQEAAAEMGLSVHTIGRHIAPGLLPAYRIGRSVRIKANDLDALARPIVPAGDR